MAKVFTSSADHKKPFHHQLITDIIIFGPVLGVLAAILDIVLNPPLGWEASWKFGLTATLFTLVGAKMRLLGISLGFHRQGTHPSYQTYPWLRGFFFMLGCMTAQGKMVNWLSDHHHHHIHCLIIHVIKVTQYRLMSSVVPLQPQPGPLLPPPEP